MLSFSIVRFNVDLSRQISSSCSAGLEGSDSGSHLAIEGAMQLTIGNSKQNSENFFIVLLF